MAVLNECATRNLEVLGVAAPELAALQQKAKDAFASASTQTSAVIDEMKKRMASLEQDTRKVVAPAEAAKPAAPAPTPKPAAPVAKAAPVAAVKAAPAPKAAAPKAAAPDDAKPAEPTLPLKGRRTGKAARRPEAAHTAPAASSPSITRPAAIRYQPNGVKLWRPM